MKYILFAVIFCVLAASLFAQYAEKNITAEHIQGAITVDGYLNETEWHRILPAGDFTQYEPIEGATPSESTHVYILYDENALYIGAMLYDSNPEHIVEQRSRRDRHTQADRFEVLIDSNNDRLSAYRFAVNVSNVQEDGIYSQDGAVYDGNWEAVWQSSTQRTDSGWSVEMRIPFSVLRFDRRGSYVQWGVNFRRFIARRNEEIHWVMVPRRESGLVSRFGALRGIANIGTPLHVTIVPYAVSYGRLRSNRLPQISEKNYFGNAGVDVKFGLTANTTLDIAVNPDFGQVEIDQTTVNLSAFETFYPEKRPFFLEGADLFRFGATRDGRELQLFYSRRIGRRPAQPDPESGQQYIEVPQATTILGAAKLTGRTAGGLSVGALSAYTNRENAIIRMPDGEKLHIPVAPYSSYNVLRMRQEIFNNSTLGIIATGVLRDRTNTAVSGGVDWNFRFDESKYVVDGFIAGTRMEQNDALLEGRAGRLYVAKTGGQHWLASANYEYFSRSFNPNEIGFIRRADYQGIKGSISYKEDNAGGFFRRYRTTLSAESNWNIDGKPIYRSAGFLIFFEYMDFWASTILYQYNFPVYDDFETRGLGLYKRPGTHMIDGWIGSDSRKTVVVYPQYNVSWTDSGMMEIYVSLNANIRPTPLIEISPSIGRFGSKRTEAWFTNAFNDALGMISLFGDRGIKQIDFSLSGLVSLHPGLSVQFFSQVLLYHAWYDNYRYLATPDDLQSYDYRRHPHYQNPDINYQAINTSVIVRWEFKRGSTVYIVWKQERSGTHDRVRQYFRDTFRDAFRTPIDNVFLIKVNYWFRV